MVESGAGAIPRQIRQDGARLGTPAAEISDHANPTREWLDTQCARLGLSLAGVCRRAFDRGPIARFLTDAEKVKKRCGRPYSLKGIGKRVLAHATDEAAIRPEVDRLDDLRYEDPEKAAAEARAALERAGGPIAVAELLGVLASAHRTLFRLDWAMVELGEAIMQADVVERRDVVAILARRAVALLCDRGALEHAEAIAREALSIAEMYGDEAEAARCLIELGVTLSTSGRYQEALRRLDSASALWLKEPRYIYAIHHGRSLCWLALDDLDAAEAEAERGNEVVPPQRFPRGHSSWLRARISWKRGRLQKAASLYEATYEAISEPAADRLLIGAEWVRVALEMGDDRGAAEQAERLLRLHGALDRDSLDEQKILSTAVLDLALAGRRVDLSIGLVERVLAQIAHGLKERSARLRERLRP